MTDDPKVKTIDDIEIEHSKLKLFIGGIFDLLLSTMKEFDIKHKLLEDDKKS